MQSFLIGLLNVDIGALPFFNTAIRRTPIEYYSLWLMAA
jgi:hypothetical protein